MLCEQVNNTPVFGLRTFLRLMTHLHCRRRTRVQTRTLIPNPMATLHYVEYFTLHRLRLGSLLPISV